MKSSQRSSLEGKCLPTDTLQARVEIKLRMRVFLHHQAFGRNTAKSENLRFFFTFISSFHLLLSGLSFLQRQQKPIWSTQREIIRERKHWIFLVSLIYKSLSKALLPVISDFLLCGRLSAWKAPLPSLA